MAKTTFHTLSDEYSGRPIAADSWPNIEARREQEAQAAASGAPAPTVAELRENYRKTSLVETVDVPAEPRTRDFEVGPWRARLYDPRPEAEAGEETPVIVYLHGGGWVIGDLETHHPLNRRLSAVSGLPVVSVDYRLAPEHPYPAAVEDSRAAVSWVTDAAAEHGLKATRLGIGGDSAGGTLTAVLSNEIAAGSLNTHGVELGAQVLFYPAVDLTKEHRESSPSYQRIARGFPLTAQTMEVFSSTYLPAGTDASATDISPLLHDLPEGLPATYLVTADNDPLAHEGAEYAARLAQAGAELTYDHLVGYAHSLFTSLKSIPTSVRYLDKAAAFFREQLAS